MINIFKKKTTDSILAAFNVTINSLLAHQAAQTAVADKKADEAAVALRASHVARDEATRAGAVAAKFAKLVDAEAK